MRGLLRGAGALLIAAAMAFFLADPARYANCVREGVSLWAVSVLPAIFPFLFLTALFTKTPLFAALSRCLEKPAAALFRVSGAGASAAVLAAVSGYPVGARTVCDLAGGGHLEEKFRLACLATTSGPMFLVGVVGSAMAGSAAVGWLLLLCHFSGVWTVSFFLRFTGKKVTPIPQKLQILGGDELQRAVLSILCVGGSIALFSAFGQMACDLLPEGAPTAVVALVRGLMEMTTGCALLAPIGTPASLAGCCFFVTFGGACVLLQQAGYLRRAGVNLAPFIAVKLMQGVVAGALCYGLALLI